jgi:hypothetical protein
MELLTSVTAYPTYLEVQLRADDQRILSTIQLFHTGAVRLVNTVGMVTLAQLTTYEETNCRTAQIARWWEQHYERYELDDLRCVVGGSC